MTDLPLPALMAGWNALLTLGALAITLLALLVAALAWRRERAMSRRYAALMTGADGADLAAALDRLAARAGDAERRLAACEERGRATAERIRRAVQHVGVHRYSAYHDSGGDQSFVVALLDDAADGVVLSSLVSRSGTRVFAKPVADGRSAYALTTEEESVIERTRPGPVG